MRNMYNRPAKEAVDRMTREFEGVGFTIYKIEKGKNFVRITATMPVEEWGRRYGEKRIVTLGNMCEVEIYY